MARARGWCFTLNNYTESEESLIRDVKAQYACVGKEIGKKTGTPHLQGFVYYKNAVRNETVTSLLVRAHWEPMASTAEKASDYCKKDRDFWEKGVLPLKQGKRTDLDAVAEQVRNGASLEEIAEENPGMYVRYSKGFAALKARLVKARTEMPTVIWLWGASGVGKTRFAVEAHDSFYMKDGTKWWDGYGGETCIIVDDFDGKWPTRDFLRFLDRYKYQGQTKGGYVWVNSPFIYITCEFHPSKFWEGTELKQVLRRITEVREVSDTNVSDTKVEGNSMPQPLLCQDTEHDDKIAAILAD